MISNRVLHYWAPVILMLGVMYYLSTDVFSPERTYGIVGMLLGWLMPGIDWMMVEKINLIIRKLGHVAQYALLAGLLYRAFHAGRPEPWRINWALYSFALVASWALLEQLHQAMTLSRSASLSDLLLNILSGCLALLILARCYIGRSARRS